MSSITYSLTNSDGDSYTLPTNTSIRLSPWNPRTSTTDRYGRDGVKAWGDKRVGERTVELAYAINQSNSDPNYAALFQAVIRSINAIFEPTVDQYWLEASDGRRMEVILTSHSIEPEQGTQYGFGRGKISLKTISPYWETQTPYSSGLVLSNGDAITITNSGSVDSYPLTSVTAGTTQIDLFRLTNEDYSGNFTELTSTSFTQNSVFQLDSVSGTITLGGSDFASALTAGGFLVLRPGANTIRYQSDSSPVTVNVEWRVNDSY